MPFGCWKTRRRNWCVRSATRACTSPARRAGWCAPARVAARILWLFLAAGGLAQALAQGDWLALRKDGIHDPKSPAIKQLQQPADALSKLTPDTTGNMVRWVQALERSEINPLANLSPNTEVRVLDLDVLLNLKGGMPIVRFPHKAHTLWLDCANCHDQLFEAKAGANRYSMLSILQGEQCGVCHGAVSFPLTECYRCHSVTRPGQGRPANPSALLPKASQ